jgi:hypothetical protein
MGQLDTPVTQDLILPDIQVTQALVILLDTLVILDQILLDILDILEERVILVTPEPLVTQEALEQTVMLLAPQVIRGLMEITDLIELLDIQVTQER